MQFARTPVVVKTVRSIRLLLSLDDNRSRAQAMHRSACNINHVSRVEVDPIQQFFGAILVNRLLKLRGGDTRLQAQSNLGTRLGMRHIPALRLSPGLSDADRLGVVGMHLDGELLVRKKKLQQKRKAFRVSCSLANQFALVLLTDAGQGFP